MIQMYFCNAANTSAQFNSRGAEYFKKFLIRSSQHASLAQKRVAGLFTSSHEHEKSNAQQMDIHAFSFTAYTGLTVIFSHHLHHIQWQSFNNKFTYHDI